MLGSRNWENGVAIYFYEKKIKRGAYLRECSHELSLGYVKFEKSVRLLYDDTK